jgi:tRNA A37 N6-isopentenylltransferase MiaA
LRLGAQEDDASAKPQAAAVVWLDLPREELYSRINRRVEAMFAAGWLDEARQLRDLPQPLSREAQKEGIDLEPLATENGRMSREANHIIHLR